MLKQLLSFSAPSKKPWLNADSLKPQTMVMKIWTARAVMLAAYRTSSKSLFHAKTCIMLVLFILLSGRGVDLQTV